MAPSKDDFKPDCVELRLIGHVAQKGFQAGSLIGLLGVAPVLAYREQSGVTFEAVTRGAGYGALGGIGLSLLLWAGKRLSIDQEGVEERVYRLHYNAGQQRVDAYTAVGSSLGLAAAAYFLHQSESGKHVPSINLVGGAAAGAVGGLLAHMLTRPREMATPNRMLHQLRH